jgi:RNA polymerase sigma-70 factor (ECF subfamily)
MQNAPAQLSIEDLLAHSDWVRRLVGGLVRDPARADDALQEIWAAALARLPRADIDRRAWLAACARNAVRKLGRGEARRKQREQVAARLEALPNTVDVIAKARLARRMTDAVLALDEPYRTTLLLRYFDELPPREIAKRLDRPVNTVRTHLERGLAKLRTELDAEYGDRETWAFAFLPLCVDRTALTTSGSLLLQTGGILMLCKFVLPAAILLILGAAWIGSESGPQTNLEAATREADSLRSEVSIAAPSQRTDEVALVEREALGAAPVTPARHTEKVLQTFAGRVVGLDGRPLVGVHLRIEDPRRPRYRDGRLHIAGRLVIFNAAELEALRREPQAVLELVPELKDALVFVRLIDGEEVGVHTVATNASGSFSVDLDVVGASMASGEPQLVLLGRGTERTANGEKQDVFVMAPLHELRGRVSNDAGVPIERVQITGFLHMDRLPAFPLILEDIEAIASVWGAESEADGRFRIASTPVVPGMVLRLSAQGYESLMHTISASDADELEFVMQRVAQRKTISGRVVDQTGGPAVRVGVVLDSTESMTDGHGAFRFEIEHLDTNSTLIAYRPGFAPAIVDDLHARYEADPANCRDLILELGAATGSISGRVVDGRGNGLNGVWIHISDGVRFTRTGYPLEGAVSKTWRELLQTDVNGGFVLDGLYRESCDLVFEDFGAGPSIRIDDVPIGTTGLEVVMDDTLVINRLEGRVLDRRGRPVAGAELASLVTQWESSGTRGRGTGGYPRGETDENGEFLLRRVPCGNTKFVVRGTGIEATEFELDPSRTSDLTFVVPLRLRFLLDRDVAPSATSFEIFDEAGKRLDFKATYTDRDIYASTGSLQQRDALPTIEVSDEANEIVFSARGVEVERKPLHLRRGEVALVR